MDYGKPILWVRNDRDSHRVVSDQHGTRFESASGSAGRVIAGVFFLVLASLPISLSTYLLSGAEETNASEVPDECWEDQVEIQVGANPLYCLTIAEFSTIISLEVSEDQHIREEIQDIEDDATTYVDTYRWEEVDSSVVYGFIWDGIYNCVRFISRNLTLKRIGRLRVCMDPFPIRNGAVPIIPMKRKGRLKRVHTPLMVY